MPASAALSAEGSGGAPPILFQPCQSALVSKGLHRQCHRPPPNFTTIPKMPCGANKLTHFRSLEGWGRPSRFPLSVLTVPPPPQRARNLWKVFPCFPSTKLKGPSPCMAH